MIRRRAAITVGANIAVGCVMLAFAAAAVLKLADLDRFSYDLATWEFLPRSLIIPLTLLIPSVEILLAGAWIVGIARQGAAVGGVVLLTLFTVVYVLHLLFAESPDCGGFGAILRFERQRDEVTAALVRNGVLLGLGWGALAVRRLVGGHNLVHVPQRLRRGGHRVTSGFTLVELVLVIVLTGILISLALPSLVTLRDKSRRLQSLANVRTHGQTFAAYTNEYDDVFPYQTDPEATLNVFRYPFSVEPYGVYAITVPYFGAYSIWHWDLLDGYYGGDAHVFDSPNDPDPEEDQLFTDYWYSHSFIARPEFWNQYTREGPNQWRPTRQSDVLYPADKALLFDDMGKRAGMISPNEYTSLDFVRMKVEIAFVDGSARLVPYRSITRPYIWGDGDFPGSWFGFGIPLMHTIDGVRGRDVK